MKLPCVRLLVLAGIGILVAEMISTPPLFVALPLFVLGLWVMWRPRFLLLAILLCGSFFVLHQTTVHFSRTAELSRELVKVHAVGRVELVVSSPIGVLERGGVGFEAKLHGINQSRLPLALPVRVVLRGEGPAVGSRVVADAMIKEPLGARNPGEFDYRRFLARKGIHMEVWILHARDVVEVDPPVRRHPMELFSKAREWMRQCVTHGMGGHSSVGALIEGVVLGVTEQLPWELRDAFQRAGVLHLFSVSGLHVGMVGALVYVLAGWFVPRKAFRSILVLIAVWSYALVTGAGVASVRAAFMATLLVGGGLIGRESHPANSAAAAAVLILAGDTNALFHSGFQLSFGAVFSLLAIVPRLSGAIRARIGPDPFLPRSLVSPHRKCLLSIQRAAGDLFAVSLAASLGTAPFTLWHFSLVSPGGVLINLYSVPLAFITLTLGLASCVAGLLHMGLATMINQVNGIVTAALLHGTSTLATLPGVCVVGHPSQWFAPRDTITILDLRESFAVVIRGERSTILIGAGGEGDYQRTLRPHLRWAGVNQLDVLILPQGEARWFGGAVSLFEEFRPRRIVQSALEERSPTRRAFNQVLDERGVEVEWVAAGDELKLDAELACRVLYPEKDVMARRAEQRGMALDWQAPVGRILIVSTLSFPVQRAIVASKEEERQWIIASTPRYDDLVDPGFQERTSGVKMILKGKRSLDGESSGLGDFSLLGNVQWLEETGAVILRKGRVARAFLDPPPY